MEVTPTDQDVIHLASGGYDHTIRFWVPHEGKCSRVIQHPNSQVNDLEITPDRKQLAVASFQHIRIYNILGVQHNNPEINLEGFNKNVSSIGFFDDSRRLFSGGEDQITRIWDLNACKNQSQRMHKSATAVNSVKLHSNQKEIFIGEQSGHINIWDLRSSEAPFVQLPHHDSSVQCLSLDSENDLLAAIDNIGYCHIFSPAHKLERLASWKAHSRYGLKCLFSPNGVYLVTTSADHTAKVWKTCDLLSTNTPPTPYKILTSDNQRWVWDVVFSADSQFCFTASSDGDVRLWHVESAEMRRQYKGHGKAVTALAFSDC